MKYHIITPDGNVREGQCGHAGLDTRTEREVVGGPIEYVKVIRDGIVCNMIVNECGTGVHGHERLPINARATAIYWENSMVWSIKDPKHAPAGKYDPLTMPLVYGTVVLYEGLLP